VFNPSPQPLNMKIAQDIAAYDAQEEGNSGGETEIQPSDPGQLSLTTPTLITHCARLWQVALSARSFRCIRARHPRHVSHAYPSDIRDTVADLM
jgi:hypothetical protein